MISLNEGGGSSCHEFMSWVHVMSSCSWVHVMSSCSWNEKKMFCWFKKNVFLGKYSEEKAKSIFSQVSSGICYMVKYLYFGLDAIDLDWDFDDFQNVSTNWFVFINISNN